jgi:hypothetical protein
LRMRSTSPTEVPPNFMTKRLMEDSRLGAAVAVARRKGRYRYRCGLRIATVITKTPVLGRRSD